MTTANFVVVNVVPRRGYDEAFVTAIGTAPYAAVAAALAEHGLQPLGERCYAAVALQGRLAGQRCAALQDHDLPVDTPFVALDGCHPTQPELASVLVTAIRDRSGGGVRTVPGGRLWASPGHRVLQLVDVQGPAGAPVTVQTETMFRKAIAAARAQALPWSRTVRTWFHLARLLDWYGEFNRIRAAIYDEQDLAYPASTGIQGRAGHGEVTLDALLVEGLPITRIDGTARQQSATRYGSSFARGAAIHHGDGCTVHVSGTASIGLDGRTKHLGDPAAQYAETILDVAAVLDTQGLRLQDIRQATLFCKDPATAVACSEIDRLLGLPAFPRALVLADVCRADLLVEMEAIACR